MLELNPIKDGFSVELPVNTIQQDILSQFNKLIEGRYTVHNDLFDYVKESLQSVTIPDIVAENLKVENKTGILVKKPVINNVMEGIDNRFALTFRCLDGMWNYWMFRLSYMQWRVSKKLDDNAGNCHMFFRSNDEYFTIKVSFIKCVIGAIEGKEFSYADTDISNMDTFTIDFSFENMDFEVIINNLDSANPGFDLADVASNVDPADSDSGVSQDTNGDGVRDRFENFIDDSKTD